MHSSTAWARSPSSSLTSDRLRPSTRHSTPSPSPSPSPSSSKTARAPRADDAPRSPAVRRLDALIAGLNRGGAQPAEACFCQARTHALSPYTPICTRCGLVLCALHLPHAPCPHCASALLAPTARAALLARLQSEIAQTRAREDEERQRAAADMRARVGAFPTLGPGPGPQSGSSSTPPSRAGTPASSEPHKVLTLHGGGAGRKAKKVTLASYTRSSPPTPRAPSPTEPAEVVWRAPPPPKEVVFAQGPRQPATLWVDLLGERVVYVDPPKIKPAPKQKRREGNS